MNGAAAGFVPGGGGGGGGYGGVDMHQQHLGLDHAEAVDEMGGLAGGWMEMGRAMDDGFPVTALAFDPVEELLWVRGVGVGWMDGMDRVSSSSLTASLSSATYLLTSSPWSRFNQSPFTT